MSKGRRALTRNTALVGTLCMLLWSGHAAAQSQTFSFDVPAEPLRAALQDVARISGQQIVFSDSLAAGKTAPALHGTYTTDQALSRLLDGTGLDAMHATSGGIMVRPKNVEAASEGEEAARPEVTGIETVTVTAEKRTEASLDVPMGLTALSGESLVRTQSFRFEDYVGKVPGLTLIADGEGENELVIRGITAGVNSLNNSVATYIDETPITAVGEYGGTNFVSPNLDTFDMQRIEVLKGPQGTLYGATALGGLLKFVTNAPDPSGFAAKVEAGVNSVYNGSAGFDLHAMVNVPLADDLALRIVGYDNYYPGFIDDPERGLKDINGSHVVGGRASLLYEPTSNLSIRVNASYQDTTWSDNPSEDVNSGTLTPIYGSLNTEGHVIGEPGHISNELYNATVNWHTDFGDIVSSTSYANNREFQTDDASDYYEATISSILGGPYSLTEIDKEAVRAVTQEVRISSPGDNALQWQVGGYFTDKTAYTDEFIYPIYVPTRSIVYDYPLNLGSFLIPVGYKEYAGFANLDYHFTPTFDVAIGGRYSRNDQTYSQVFNGLLAGGHTAYGQTSSQDVFTYSGDVRWHVTPESMLYARIATGFVPGGPNDAVPTSDLPHTYQSSSTINYEVGIKNSLLDNRLTVELSAFDIYWQRIQLVAIIDDLGTETNGGTAQSDGVEWNVSYIPVAGLNLNFNGAYTDARLTQATPASVGGLPGDRLPSSPFWEYSASADYERPLFGNYSGFGGVDWRFTGSRYAEFEPVGTPRQDMPSFGIVDVRAGVETPGWSLAIYAKNLGNTIAINYAALEAPSGAQLATVYTPRTIGLELTANF